MEINEKLALALDFACNTSETFFLTGKAGTGKTTFLKTLKEKCTKKMIVVAPTGVAAINAGGVTIHSFFQIPPGPFLPVKFAQRNHAMTVFNDQQSLLKNLKLRSETRGIMKSLELLIIDEISMVRADLLDCIDFILRVVRNNQEPFGGVQVLFIGDLYQLPPITNKEDEALLIEYYEGFYFFNAQVFRGDYPMCIELSKVYRQADENFISLLNNIRNNEMDQDDMELLESYYQPQFVPMNPGEYITLSSHNYIADQINREELDKLKGRVFNFEGEKKGEFNERNVPVNTILQLKEGAQVMFVKNDKGEPRRYFNGKIGIISAIDDEFIRVKFPVEELEIEVEKETWKNIRYEKDEVTDEIEEKEIGSFTQYPIKLAWAITVHKSQGLTFERAIVEVGAAFAAGQVYVALSRLTSLDGLVLKSRITPSSIFVDQRIKAYFDKSPTYKRAQEILSHCKREYFASLYTQAYNWSEVIYEGELLLNSFAERSFSDLDEARQFIQSLVVSMNEINVTAHKFLSQLNEINKSQNDDLIFERLFKAEEYFKNTILLRLINPLLEHIKIFNLKSKTKQYIKAVYIFKSKIENMNFLMSKATLFAQAAVQNMGVEAQLNIESNLKNKKLVQQEAIVVGKKAVKGESQLLSFTMYKEGLSVEEIAQKRGMAVSTIDGHICGFIETGEIKVEEIVPASVIEMVQQELKKYEEKPALNTLKEALPSYVSYQQIRAVIASITFSGR